MLIQEESLSRKFITKGAWIYFFVFLTAPLGYLIRIILTGDLTPSEVGIIYGTIGLLGLLGSYTDFGLTESLNYFLPKYIIKNDYPRVKYLLSITLFVQVLTSTIVSIGLYFLANWLANHYFHAPESKGVIEILSLYFIGSHLLVIITTFLNSIQNIKVQKTIDFIRSTSVVIGASILLFSEQGNIITYSWVWILGLYTALICAAIVFYTNYYTSYLQGEKVVYDTSLRKTFIQYSLGTLFSANVATVLHQIDMQFITYFLGVSDTGIYSIYLSLIGIPFIFIGPIIGFLYPVISEIGGRGDKEKIRNIFTIFSTHLSVIILWMGAIFITAGVSIAGFLFGERFITAGIALYFIAPFLVFNILMQIQFQILSGLGFIKKRIEILLWTLTLNIIVSLICILGFKYGYIPFPNGSSAASFAVGSSWILMWYLSYRAVGEYIGGFDWKYFLKNIIVCCVFIGIFLIGKEKIYGDTLPDTRMEHVKLIGLALSGSLTIFLTINIRQIRIFLTTIKNVRNGSL